MTTKTKRTFMLLLLGTLASTSQSLFAQNNLTSPRPIMTSQPAELMNAAGADVEGWVTVRYSVLANGTPTDVRAIDVMPPTADPLPALAAVRQWKFSPGMRNGQAIDWHNNESILVFGSPADLSVPSPDFQDRYFAIGAMIDAEDYDNALAANRSLLNDHATRLSEIGLALAQNAIIQLGRLDFHSALVSARKSTDPRITVLGGADLFVALQLRFRVEAQLGRTRDALGSYARIAQGLGPNDIDIFADVGTQLKAALAETEFLEVAGRIDREKWRLDASRRYFYIDNIQGEIESIDAECDTRKISLDFQPEADYQLPDSFGNCTLFIEGKPDTAFSFIEVLLQED